MYRMSLLGQISFERIYHFTEPTRGIDVVETPDGGFAMAVEKSSSIPGLIRIDDYGDTLWTKWYDDLVSTHGPLRVSAITQTTDNNFYLAGRVESNTVKAFVIKINDVGNVEWMSVRNSNPSFAERYHDIVAHNNDSIILVGDISIAQNNYCCSPILDIVGSGGNITSIGGGSTTGVGASLYTASKDSNGDLIITGLYPKSIGIGRLTKRAIPGNFLWNKFYTSIHLTFTSIALGPQDEIQTVGTTYSSNFDSTLVFVFDSEGNFISRKAYSCTEQYWEGVAIVRSNDAYFVGGSTGNPSSNFALMKLSLDHELISCQTFGGTTSEFFEQMISTTDGGVAMIGRSISSGYSDTYLVKTNASGSVVSTNSLNVESTVFDVYPNPCRSYFTFTSSEVLDNVSMSIYSLNGTRVLNKKGVSGNEVEVDVNGLPSGVYILTIEKDNAVVNTEKIVILN